MMYSFWVEVWIMNLSESIEILEIMQQNLSEEYETGNDEDEKIKVKEEIRALKNIMRFINIIFKSFPRGLIKKIIKEDTVRHTNMSKRILDQYYKNNDNTAEDNENYEYIYTADVKLFLGHKIIVSIVKYKERKYIIMEPQEYDRKKFYYTNWGSFKFPIEIIKENKKVIKEINKDTANAAWCNSEPEKTEWTTVPKRP
jgi:hypothetical protein